MDATELAFAGAARQAQLLADGEITAPELLEVHLERIHELQPRLNAFRIVRAAAARRQAADAQERLEAGERTPLLGVPIAIKDDVDVEGEVTAWGSDAHGPAKTADAEVVRRLRRAGAVLVGKTSVPEMTLWPFTETLTFGATRNPWDPHRTPGGSSGGSGAAVASGQVALALGSDGAGSIRIPAAWCGLFGIKPQRDRVPMSPHDDAWNGLSVNGPLARRVADAAAFLDVTADDAPAGGFAAAAAREPGRLRIAISLKAPPGAIARLGDEHRQAVLETAELLRTLGHDVVERDPDFPGDLFLQVTARYLNGAANDVATMPHPERLERRTQTMARIGRRVPVARMRAREAESAKRVNAIFDDVDIVLSPVTAGGPFRIGQLHGRGATWTVNVAAAMVPWLGAWNALGNPAASVPAGTDADGLPMGVQLVGRPSDEATLLSLSAQLEQARPWADRRPVLA